MIRVWTFARCAVLIGALGGLPLSAMQARAQGRREAMGPLRPHPQNPRYFADGGGRAVYLTGSHTWANLQDQGPKDPPKPFDYEAYLDFLRERNHNVIRLWAWEQARWAPWSDGKGQNPSDWFIDPNPYARSVPGKALDGKPKFNLEKWDDAYFDRLRTRVRKAGERGDLRLGDALPGLELRQELAGRHALARSPVPPREQRPGLEWEHEGRHRPGARRPARPRAAGRLHTQSRGHAE